MTTNKPQVFVLEPWLTIPFEERLKSPIDELVDILLTLPECLALYGKISNQASRCSRCIVRLQMNIPHIISRLDSWHQQYCVEIVEYDGRRRIFLDGSAERRLDMSELKFYAPDMRTYHDIHTAAFIAMYDAANLIIFSVLKLVSMPTDQYSHRINFHTQSILSADTFIESSGFSAPTGGAMPMIFPLKIVGLWGPHHEQRSYATAKLRKWDRQGELHGICRLAAPVSMEPPEGVLCECGR